MKKLRGIGKTVGAWGFMINVFLQLFGWYRDSFIGPIIVVVSLVLFFQGVYHDHYSWKDFKKDYRKWWDLDG